MASLLKDPLFEISGTAPAPNKTFYHLAITKSEVIWNWWKISLRAVDRYARPGEVHVSHQELLEDTRLLAEITIVFGRDVLDYVKSLCQGHFNYLEQLSDALLLHILGFLELEDVGQLIHTSHRFWKLCQSEEFWENAVRQRCSTLPDEVVDLARDMGWRRIFFTNKIQLQLLVNRHRVKLQEAVTENERRDQIQKREKSPEDESSGANDEELESSSSVSPNETLSSDGVSPVHSLDSDNRSYSDLTSSSDDNSKHLVMEDVLEGLEKVQEAGE